MHIRQRQGDGARYFHTAARPAKRQPLEDCSKVYRFEEFETAIEALDRALKPRGILSLYNSNFNFLDTVVAERYEVLAGPGIWKDGFVHRFDRDHRRVRTITSDCIYRKLSDAP